MRRLVMIMVLGFSACCMGQDPPNGQPLSRGTISVLYTGRTMGYFRWPDEQPDNMLECRKDDPPADSNSGALLKAIGKLPRNQRLLLGTGDNFAPELFARTVVASGSPAGTPRPSKDRYDYDWIHSRWVLQASDTKLDERVEKALAAGRGMIPADNVGCFLAKAGYDALVPGKHDFYFGPERLRLLARFLASIPEPEPGDAQPDYSPVQMLAANLVIQTRDTKAAERLAYHDRRPTYSDDKGALAPSIADGDMVFPWLREIKVEGTNENHAVFICEELPKDSQEHDPDRFHVPTGPLDSDKTCFKLAPKKEKGKEKEKEGKFGVPAGRLAAHSNYALCITGVHANPPSTYCARFGVYSPFFTAAWDMPAGVIPSKYKDPEPYLLKSVQTPEGESVEVAVFGVVDPKLTEHVGELNLFWDNTNERYVTEVKATEPVVALRQLIQTFNADYEQKHKRSFRGYKVLLAQMSHVMAEQLATKLKGDLEFHLVLSEAQLEHATPVGRMEFTIAATVKDSEASWPAPTVVATPAPFYSDSQPRLRLQLQTATLKQDRACDATALNCEEVWAFDSRRNAGELKYPHTKLLEDPGFDQAIRAALDKTEFQPHASNWSKPLERLQMLSLAVLRQKLSADVAMLQKRDIFEPYVEPPSGGNLQENLDRIFWKGDFAVRILVKGSALKSVLDQSSKFDQEDASDLSLAASRRRGLALLGIFRDKSSKTYFVNGEQLDPEKLYSVATSDYVALGDTGYPDLLKNPWGQPLLPRNLKRLPYLSGLVCEHIRQAVPGYNAVCSAPPQPTDYFDESTQVPLDTTPGRTSWRNFKIWLAIHQRRQALLPEWNNKQELEFKTQQRPIWSVKLEKASVSYDIYRHNNDGEANLASRFAGVPVPQVNAPNTSTWAMDWRARQLRSGRLTDFFTLIEGAFSRKLTGQADAPTSVDEAQNMLAFEAGILPRLLPREPLRREIPWLQAVFSARMQTLLARPLTSFRLNTSPPTVLRGRIGRTKDLLFKLGLRFQNEKSWMEGGYELGGRFGTPSGFRFNPDDPAAKVECFAAARKDDSLATCVKNNSTPDANGDSLINSDSSFEPIRTDKFLHGLFLNFKLSAPLPFNKNLAYVMENRGDVFFNRGADRSVDTKFLDVWSHSLTIPMKGNLNLVPKWEMVFYQNMRDFSFFRSTKSSITLQYGFEWHKGLPLRKALIYKNPMPK